LREKKSAHFMTFSEALDRLPSCSYAVNSEETPIGRVVEVWFLYYEDADEIDDPMAEGGPCVDVQGSYYDEEGRRTAGGPSDWMPVEDVPEEKKELDWRPVEVDIGELPTSYHVDVLLHVLDGKPLQEARYAEKLPPQMPSWVTR
jgi:hypothetical protein